MGPPLIQFFYAYFLTNLIEFLPFVLLIKKISIQKKIINLLIINLITVPVVWLVLPQFYAHYLIAFIVVEAIVIIAESVLIKKLLKLSFNDSFKTAVVMNFLSAVFGFVFF